MEGSGAYERCVLMLNFDEYLFVTEVGSRMWGMADETSDYDLFCCYNTTAKEYLRSGEFERTKPHRNFMDGDKEYDIQYMEIGHLVKLLMKGNINALWAVCSPIIHKESSILVKLKDIVLNNLSLQSYASIKGIATSQFMDAEKRINVRTSQKSLKTCMRTLNFGCNLFAGGGVYFDGNYLKNIEVTKEMCEKEFGRFDLIYDTSSIKKEPRCDHFYDFIMNFRLKEIEDHIKVKVVL